MKSDILHIIGRDDKSFIAKINKSSKIIFLDKEQKDFVNQFSLIRNFNERQNFLREKWLIFQEEVFKKIQPSIDQDEDFRYILSSLFFEASPYKTNVMYQFFKLYLVINYIKKENIKKVFLVNVSRDISAFFSSNIKYLDISVKAIKTQKNKFFLKQLIQNNALISMFYHLYVEYKRKRQKISSFKNQSSKAVFSYYSFQSINNEFLNKYFSDVSNLLKENYASLFLYVGKISNLGKENKILSNNSNTYGFLDSYFLLSDFKNITLDFYRIQKKLKSIKLKNLFVFEGINYLSITKGDWLKSICYILLQTLIFEKKFKNFLKDNSKIEEIIYLMEFQPWELMLNKVAHKYGIKTKGITHAVIRPNMLQYFHPKSIHPFFYNPTFVGANSNFCEALYLRNGFSSDQVLKIEAQRFNYLDYALDNIDEKKTQIRKSILITTSITSIETKELLEVFALANVKFDKIYIKEHPNLPVKPIIESLNKKFPSYEIFEGSIANAFENSDIVYTANGSSVLFESVLNKKHTVTLISLSSLPMPAIEQAPNLHFAYDTNSLSKILSQLMLNPKTDFKKNNINNDLYLSKNLNLWRNFINK